MVEQNDVKQSDVRLNLRLALRNIKDHEKKLDINLSGIVAGDELAKYGFADIGGDLFRIEFAINHDLPNVRAHLSITE